ncbi:hypothetical protein Lgra_1687 [Legionella gratiana]|uniref:Uncharacterized protein n=1 Tax=Legionella gratiana TaxID=45066 RepID=A0A378J9G3_9GAMM|nr:hypothetical protein [Legionella gratiana]KTD10721.1 hypothetical protein Lgra_1687 [Legionella gratiana]STX43798.1 Uncharacterised protein [Legionella gratiana]
MNKPTKVVAPKSTEITTEIDGTQDTENKKEKGRYEDYITNMKLLKNNLTFFSSLIEKNIKNPNDENLKELQNYVEHLPLCKSPKSN